VAIGFAMLMMYRCHKVQKTQQVIDMPTTTLYKQITQHGGKGFFQLTFETDKHMQVLS
jgi:hypothetical protein